MRGHTPVLAIHGGAGLSRSATLSPEREERCHNVLRASLDIGYAILTAGGSALEACQAAVVHLEDEPTFNAGRGAVLGADGCATHDACIMDGRRRDAGAVACTRTIRNPILAARGVLERSRHALLVGIGADQFAVRQGLECVDPRWFITEERHAQLLRVIGSDEVHLDHHAAPDEYGTVGAVACDSHGHLAAATSTGGMVNKQRGRVGDTPLVGAGTWADDTCAVSGTGHGEMFIRLSACSRVAHLVEFGNLSLEAAAQRTLRDLSEIGGEGGMIAVDRSGHITLPFNSGGMFRGWVSADGSRNTAIW